MRSMSGWRSAAWSWLVPVWLALPAWGQVPEETTFSGQLVDGGGMPLAGPVTIELWIFDADTAGTALYAEQHASVPLDAEGNFSVLLGTGADAGGPFPPFDPSLFSGLERYVEVRVGVEVLSPRVPIASVPWALVARQANEIVADPSASFEDCGDGTVADPQTGLRWEKKTGTPGGPGGVLCETEGCPDPHDVNNAYEWADTAAGPDGGIFTDFLAKLNDQVFGTAASPSEPTGCLAGHCDWRLPNIVELQTILDCSHGDPCIDPIFGPTMSSDWYWSASTDIATPAQAWIVGFSDGTLASGNKQSDWFVRAVRIGPCD